MSSKLVQERSAQINRVTGGLVAPSLDVPGEFDDVSDKVLRHIEALLTTLTTAIIDLRIETTALRLGMIDAGTCNEVNVRDAELPLVMS